MSMPYGKVQTPRGSRDLATLKTILIIADDEHLVALLFQAISQRTPYLAIHAANASQAMTIARDIKPDVLLLASSLPEMSGLEFYDHFHATEVFEDIPSILMSDYSLLVEREIEHRQLAILWKPFSPEELIACIEQAVTS
jgi:CheY-like chemotaxis protein